MGVLNIAYGPWKSLLVGKYEGRDVSIYLNPEKDILSVIVDRDEKGKPRGLVIVVYRLFVVEEGEAEKLIEHIEGRPIATTRKWKGSIFRFVVLPAGPKYIGLEKKEIEETVKRLVNTLKAFSNTVIGVGRVMGMRIKKITEMPDQYLAAFLAEPALVTQLIPSPTSRPGGGSVFMGVTRSGEEKRENIVSLRRVIVSGESEKSTDTALKLVLESLLVSGVNVVVVTRRSERFIGFEEPAERTPDHDRYRITPIGIDVQAVGSRADLSVSEADVLLYALGVDDEERAEYVKPALTFRDMYASIGGTTMKELSVGRVLTAGDKVYGDRVGEHPYSLLTSRAESGIGSLFLFTVSDEWDVFGIYTLVRGLYTTMKKRGKTDIPRVVLVLDAGSELVTTEDKLRKSLVSSLYNGREFGIGWVVRIKPEEKVIEPLKSVTETYVVGLDDGTVAIRGVGGKPYRVIPRPPITAGLT